MKYARPFDILIVLYAVFFVAKVNNAGDNIRWNIVPFMAVVEQYFQDDVSDIKETVYNELEHIVSENSYYYLTSYKSCVKCYESYTSTEGFSKHMAQARSNSISTWVCIVLRWFGMPLWLSVLLPVYAAVFFIIVLSYIWLVGLIGKPHAFLLAAIIAFLPGMAHVQNDASPAAVSSFLLLLSIYLIYTNRNLSSLLAVVFLSVFAFVDNLAFALIVIAAILIKNRKKLLFGYIGLIVSVLIVLVVLKFMPESSQPMLQKIKSRLAMYHIPKQLKGQWTVFLDKGYYFYFFALLLLCFCRDVFIRNTAFIVLMTVILHFALFPVLEYRYFAAYNIASVLLVVSYMAKKKANIENKL
ncbi:MAG: hypothetical protein H6551_12540 [Chitinophagales bacterium]|nr:hypothetical protein [Chitinophagaceae bacterium]MCB9065959.1 hypothetical protein [Chitinophagales bacterium]